MSSVWLQGLNNKGWQIDHRKQQNGGGQPWHGTFITSFVRQWRRFGATLLGLLAGLLLAGGPARALELFPSCALQGAVWKLASNSLNIPAGAVSGQSLGQLATADVYVRSQTTCPLEPEASLVNAGGMNISPAQFGGTGVTGNDGLWSTSNPQIKVRVTGNGVLARFPGNNNTMLTIGSASGATMDWGAPDGFIHFKMEAIYVGSGSPTSGSLTTQSLPMASYSMGLYWPWSGTNYYDMFQVLGVDGDPGTITVTGGGGSGGGGGTQSVSLSKTLRGDGTLTKGQSAIYRFEVTNTGASTLAGSLAIYEWLPFAMSYFNATAGTNTSTASCDYVRSDSAAQATLYQCNLGLPAAGLAPGAKAQMDITVQPFVQGAVVRNRARVDTTAAKLEVDPSVCVSTGVPDGCAVTPDVTIGPLTPLLSLSKSNPVGFTAGALSDYSLVVSNSGGATGRVDIYDKLPFGLGYAQASGADCTVQSDDTTGQLLKCTTTASLAAGGSTTVTLSVRPSDALVGSTVRNLARLDPTGANAVQAPGDCVATGNPAGCSVTASLTVNPTTSPPPVGNSFQYTVPAGIFELRADLMGGGGGTAGKDAGAVGGTGGVGGLLSGRLRVTPGQVFQVVVGAGGGSGSEGQALPGGPGGTGGLINPVMGGQGGASGGAGTSGSGGGGGGATSLALLSAPNNLLMLAGGGGGGQGGAWGTVALAGQNGNGPGTISSAYCPVFAGGKGASLLVTEDGGGGGGGGSGAIAGLGGAGRLDTQSGGEAATAGASCYSSQVGLFATVPTLTGGNNSGATGSGTLTPLPPKLGLALSTSGLFTGAVSTYTATISNTGTGGSDTTLTFYSLLPAQVSYNGVALNTTGTVSATATPVCSVLSGTVDSGQLLSCTLSLPAGGIPAGGQTKLDLLVVPTAAASSLSLVHKAQIDPSSLNAVQSPASCSANGTPAGCAVLTSSITANPPPAGASSFQYTVPAGIYEIRASLLGGGGGTGGNDSTDLGAAGGAGGRLTGQLRVTPGQVLQVVVGANGGNGVTGRTVAGGSGGAGGRLNWVYAGNGGASGGIGGSGSGGGGGGATSLAFLAAPADLLMVAGGGGGGQGGAWKSTAVVGQAGNGPALITSATCPVLAGAAGTALPSTQDGGGGGGGGSGATAGTSGTGHRDTFVEGVAAGAGASCYSSRAGLFGVAPALAAGSNPAASGAGTITPLPPQLALALSTPGLQPGAAGLYTVSISNSGTGGSNPTLTFYTQLPAKVAYTGVVANTGGTVSVTATPVCTVLSSAVDNGPLMSCTLSLPPGGVPIGGQVKVDLQVRPAADLAGQTLVHKAQIDPSSQNAVQTPVSCTANGSPAGCALLSSSLTGPSLVLSKSNPTQLTVWQAAAYGLSLRNSGTLASGTSLTVYDQLPANVQYSSAAVVTGSGGALTPTAVACTASGSVSTGQLLSCSLTLPSGGLPVGGSTAFQISVIPQVTAVGTSVLNKAQIDPSGNNAPQTPASCTATGTPAGCAVTTPLTVQAARARLSLSAISIGGVGSFLIRGDNGWVDQTLLTTAPNTPVQGDTQTLSNLNVATTLTETLPAGWALNSVNCVDSNASQSGNPAGTFSATLLGGGQWQLPPTYVKAGANLSCTLTNRFGGFVISGQILIDNGIGQGVAHDGVQNGGEQGQPGITLSLSNCTGTVYASGVSDGAGQFSLGTGNAPAGPVCLQQSLPTGYTLVSTRGGTAGASYNRSNGALTFNLVANTSYSGLLFGNVNTSLLSGEGSQQIQPGQSAIYSHLYTPATSASASLSTTNTASTSGQMWNSVLYRDLNCNGQLDPSDGVIPVTQTLNVLANQQICLLVRVFSPANAPPGTPNRTRLTVMEVLQPVPDISVGTILRYLAVEDQTALSNAGSGLVLFKQVRKVSNCPSSAADQQEFAISNRAAPGDYVEYQLSYSNNSAGPLSRIVIEDAVPAYTSFRSAGCGTALPAGLQGCSVTQQPGVGGSGGLQWTLKDQGSGVTVGLQPGGQGTVVFCVQLQL